jgi:hypothetical protein
LETHALLHTNLFGQKQMASLENLSDLCKNLFPVAAPASMPRTTLAISRPQDTKRDRRKAIQARPSPRNVAIRKHLLQQGINDVTT